MSKPRNRRLGGEFSVQNADGTLSAYPLHEQMVDGVDDSDFRARTRRKLLEKGLMPAQVDPLFPDLTPSKGSRSNGTLE